jgi:hypothetical protein
VPHFFPCPYLGADVELTDERETHIRAEHPELLPDHLDWIAQTLLEPQHVALDGRSDRARLLAHWYDQGTSGKHAVIVVLADIGRHWIVTAYVANELTSAGAIRWKPI